MINSFATFLFLSNVKFLNLCLDLLLPVQVCTIAIGSCMWVVFNDPSIDYFSHQHLPYAALGLATFFLFFLTPNAVSNPVPFSLSQKCLRVIPQRWQIALRIFEDSFQGCLKDGIEPTNRECRWFSVVPILLQMMIFITTYSVTFVSHFLFAGTVTMMLLLATILTILTEPYNHQLGHYYLHCDHGLCSSSNQVHICCCWFHWNNTPGLSHCGGLLRKSNCKLDTKYYSKHTILFSHSERN